MRPGDDVLDRPETVRGDDLYQRRLHGLAHDEDAATEEADT